MYKSTNPAQELLYIAALVAGLWVICTAFGLTYWLLAAALVVYLGWHFYHLRNLVRWLDGHTKHLPPSAYGVWGYIYYRLEIKRRKAVKRKKQVGRLLKQFKSSTRALPDAAVVLNKNFDIQWQNSAATEILGIRKFDVGQPITNLIRHPDFSRYLAGEDYTQGLQLEGQQDQNSRIEVTIVPYEGKQYLLLARDVTQEHLLELMRRDFVSNASHELRTPLSVLRGSVEQMEQEVQAESPLAKPLARMRRQCERMTSILQDLLILARLESRNKPMMAESVDLSSLVFEIVDEVRAASAGPGGHDIQSDISSGIRVFGEQEDLHSAISNLIMNAVRYTPEDGDITVSLKAADDDVRFEVADTGFGIPQQHLARLTERFYRVDVGRSRESGGTGLGLSIVKHLLEQYNSALEVSSEPGVGSIFGFTLPSEFVASKPDTGGPPAIAAEADRHG